jgi:hypothetical protein
MFWISKPEGLPKTLNLKVCKSYDGAFYVPLHSGSCMTMEIAERLFSRYATNPAIPLQRKISLPTGQSYSSRHLNDEPARSLAKLRSDSDMYVIDSPSMNTNF